MSDDGAGRPAPPTEGRSRRDLSADQQFWQLCRQGRRPELEAFLAARRGLPSAEVAAVLAIDQYERWLAGDRVPAEDYLRLLPADDGAAEAACDVVYGEVLLREQLGEVVSPEEYARRFPAYAEALTRQLQLHRALALEAAPGPTVHGEPGAPPPGAPALPGYEVLDEIGRGGMGVVYRARQVSLDREVALKVVPARGAGGGEALARAAREAQVLARLSHPHIVTVHDAGVTPEAFYLAMELIDGTDLHRFVEKEGPFSIPLACDLLRQAALGLAHAHERGLVHRDIKPSNLLVVAPAPGGPAALKILDLGLARLMTPAPESAGAAQTTQVGAFLGTPDFIAPEQANDPRAADARSDLYSLGCTFFYALTGRPPFVAATPLAKLMQHHLAGPPALLDHRPDAPAALAELLARLLAKRPEDRPQSAAEVAVAVAGLTRERPVGPSAVANLPGVKRPVGNLPHLAAGPRLVGHTDWVKCVAFTADGQHVASGGLDRTVRLWEVATGREVWRGEAGGGVLSVAARPGRAGLVSGGEDRAVVYWPPDGAAPAWRGVGHGHNVNAVTFTPDGRHVLSASHDGSLRLWAVEGGQALRSWAAHAGAVWSAVVLPGGRLALSAGQDRTVRLWDVMTGEAVGAGAEQSAPLSCVAVTPDGRTALVGAADGLVRLWDLKSLSQTGVLEGHAARVTALAVSPDGRRAVSASRDQALRVWGLDTGASQVLGGHSHWVTCVAWSPDGQWVCSGSGDRSVCLWQARG